MSCTTSQRMSDWSDRPLCRRYAAVVVDRMVVGRPAGQTDGSVFGWALGTLNDGQAEVLGWWQPSESRSDEWPAVSARLAARGVEHIGVVVDDSGIVTGHDAFGLPQVLVHARSADAGTAGSTLPPRVRRHVARARTTGKRVQTALSLAVRRGWDGEGEIAAAAFLDDALQRIDRQLSTQMAAPTARRSGVAGAA
jgi:hypothetical protein